MTFLVLNENLNNIIRKINFFCLFKRRRSLRLPHCQKLCCFSHPKRMTIEPHQTDCCANVPLRSKCSTYVIVESLQPGKYFEVFGHLQVLNFWKYYGSQLSFKIIQHYIPCKLILNSKTTPEQFLEQSYICRRVKLFGSISSNYLSIFYSF